MSIVRMKIDGVIDRISLTAIGHRLGLTLLLVGRKEIFGFAYADDACDPSIPRGVDMMLLTQPGDHVWSYVGERQSTQIGVPGSFRNWTLEHRQFGKTSVIGDEQLNLPSQSKQLPVY